MAEQEPTKEASLSEVKALRRRVAELERVEAERRRSLTELRQVSELLFISGIRERDLVIEADRERAKLRALVDAIPDEVWFVDEAGHIQLINRAVAQSLGLDPEEVRRRPASELLASPEVLTPDGKSSPPEQAPLLRALNGQVVIGWEERVRDPHTGEWRDKQVSSSPVRDSQGRIIGAIAVARDITARKAAERQLQDLNDTLERRVGERTGQLRALAARLVQVEEQERRRLAVLLHDGLQQTLVAAMLQLNFAQRHTGHDSQPWIREALRFLGEAVDSSRSLTAELSPAILHDDGLIPALHWLGRRMYERYGLDVTVDIAGDAALRSIPQDLAVVLYHCANELLFNVYKHASVQKARVELASSAPDRVRLTVADEGRGLEMARAAGAKASGGGFGLLNVQERILHAGGEFAVDSAPGHGTRITLSVPLVPDSAPTAAQDAVPVQVDASADAHTPHKLRLVLVDDHAIVRRGLTQLLNNEPDLEVVGESGDGLAAMALVREVRPDVVLMDITMPRLDGIEATQRLVAEFPGVCVIGLSMFDDVEKAMEMRRAGAVAYVAKGGPPESLIAAIRACRSRISLSAARWSRPSPPHPDSELPPDAPRDVNTAGQ